MKKLVHENAVKTVDLQPIADIKEIPPKMLFNSDMKQLKGFREVRIGLKQDALFKDFVESMTNVLDLFDNSSRKYDSDIVQFVCQSAEDTFISHKKMGPIKLKSVIAICKRYFNNDEELVAKIIDMVLPIIKQSTFYRRNKTRAKQVCFWFLNSFGINL